MLDKDVYMIFNKTKQTYTKKHNDSGMYCFYQLLSAARTKMKEFTHPWWMNTIYKPANTQIDEYEIHQVNILVKDIISG